MQRNTKARLSSYITLCVTFAAVMFIAQRGDPVVTRTNLEKIPMQIGAYEGTEDSFSEAVYTELNADLHLYRHYRSPDGNVISLYIGYYGTAKGGRTGHNPYACLPSAGWGIIQTDHVNLASGGGNANVNAIIAKKGNVYETVLHWYQSDKNKVLANGIQQNIQRMMGRVLHNRNDGAFVRLSMQTPYSQLEEARKEVKHFAEKLLAILPAYWPEER